MRIRLLLLTNSALIASLWAASHREAPLISQHPQVDGTDFYMFRSYEPGRSDFVTLIADYNPLQDPGGGPNFFPLDSNASYEIHISNDGDPAPEMTFEFRFVNQNRGLALRVGPPDNELVVPAPLQVLGPFSDEDTFLVNEVRRFWVRVKETTSSGTRLGGYLADADTGDYTFQVPFDNVGPNTVDYGSYSQRFVRNARFPGCEVPGRVFVGQRRDPYRAKFGDVLTGGITIDDLLGAPDARKSETGVFNVTSLALEVPIDCLRGDPDRPVITGWTSASLPRQRDFVPDPTLEEPDIRRGEFVQVSRLGNPLVNDLIIGIPAKDNFNASVPGDDAQFEEFFTHPSLPELIEQLFGTSAPNQFPRDDLVDVFLTGIPGLNQDGSRGEVLRLNTSIPPVPAERQNSLGALAGDRAGWPNGRRPGDDVMDGFLTLMMNGLDAGANPRFTDGVPADATGFGEAFPYLNLPLGGSVD